MKNFLKNKKTLLVGLGQLGGGVSTAKFLTRSGAKLTVTDVKPENNLKNSIRQLKNFKTEFHLGGHKKEDFEKSDFIIFNPAVSVFSPWVKLAKKLKKEFFNDYTLFLKLLQSKDIRHPYIEVTGTRGKTTVATWIGHFLSPVLVGGNIPSAGLLKIIDKISSKKPLVLEISSYQLEYVEKLEPPKVSIGKFFHIAVITNLSCDHLNRYGNLKTYINVKSKIFINQKKSDILILNHDDKYTHIFLSKKPKSRIYFFSLRRLPKNKNGVWFLGNSMYFQENNKKSLVMEKEGLTSHQKLNLAASLLASYLAGKNWRELSKKLKNLPEIKFRQQLVLKKNGAIFINDSAATSPVGTIAALERFYKDRRHLALVCGGTDKNLYFKDLAKKIKATLPSENLFLLEGSATKKLAKELERLNYFKNEFNLFKSLEDIIEKISEEKHKVVLFSPAAASFEKFKNEFDRGNKFNKLIKKYFAKK
ncbi:UDP-N-acetylmuramoyl-L-alanine--D-glutamate ligase [bacterium (Candidatus Moisslbacteria) CG12_big_fil_rev_8_21_14_0_65_36_11]|nr:UDP-N-acetylmuramoyl-L-alanine--D-glutamate ligase [Candidatus Kuenenbacteria bacterium]OIP76567.1 MAG: UDP-N-acetylmuramoylalanine--D-glutamate ligase [Parcubacteria group bacterium CG2_30_36_38]PIW68169.1 MAG: UDP-N-acetylmuramoyl-L-alanine--D-glutamate ligase [bacterium (Candidatus Moisslbacteria) CG12_big_fil_rev_8_21_14_0_65_36_11]PJC00834.1 MAG: UDP-N-acetylmuramoyl-L-alanine--D-glutamate ligase [bacterium (Candidatus Moisslbacteria) CG_4_9_14_0_8_um_filter_36_20]